MCPFDTNSGRYVCVVNNSTQVIYTTICLPEITISHTCMKSSFVSKVMFQRTLTCLPCTGSTKHPQKNKHATQKPNQQKEHFTNSQQCQLCFNCANENQINKINKACNLEMKSLPLRLVGRLSSLTGS